jgi:hypothetical protein
MTIRIFDMDVPGLVVENGMSRGEPRAAGVSGGCGDNPRIHHPSSRHIPDVIKILIAPSASLPCRAVSTT